MNAFVEGVGGMIPDNPFIGEAGIAHSILPISDIEFVEVYHDRLRIRAFVKVSLSSPILQGRIGKS